MYAYLPYFPLLFPTLPLLTPFLEAESSQTSGDAITEDEENRAATIASHWQKVAIALIIACITLCQVFGR